ncbi:hypothetical protein Taro_022859 [Colocasia esculenta]|uniref:Uncharacterized protein n=1 Tax=Colocasia esculenta TaxID=4460 RepID=A0A843V2Q2_COLES|nr:hypothetical protein [Colocasia esculenta]
MCGPMLSLLLISMEILMDCFNPPGIDLAMKGRRRSSAEGPIVSWSDLCPFTLLQRRNQVIRCQSNLMEKADQLGIKLERDWRKEQIISTMLVRSCEQMGKRFTVLPPSYAGSIMAQPNSADKRGPSVGRHIFSGTALRSRARSLHSGISGTREPSPDALQLIRPKGPLFRAGAARRASGPLRHEQHFRAPDIQQQTLSLSNRFHLPNRAPARYLRPGGFKQPSVSL